MWVLNSSSLCKANEAPQTLWLYLSIHHYQCFVYDLISQLQTHVHVHVSFTPKRHNNNIGLRTQSFCIVKHNVDADVTASTFYQLINNIHQNDCSVLLKANNMLQYKDMSLNNSIVKNTVKRTAVKLKVVGGFLGTTWSHQKAMDSK